MGLVNTYLVFQQKTNLVTVYQIHPCSQIENNINPFSKKISKNIQIFHLSQSSRSQGYLFDLVELQTVWQPIN